MSPRYFRGNFQDHLKDILGEEMFSGADDQISGSTKYPKINLYESKEKIFIIGLLPGLRDPSQVHISLVGSSLLIKGKIDQPQRREEIKLICSECSEGEFERSIQLPASVSGIGSVNYRNGLLHIELMKEHRTDSVNVKVQFS
jgi:HSP20 family molecular chaperone IbpA